MTQDPIRNFLTKPKDDFRQDILLGRTFGLRLSVLGRFCLLLLTPLQLIKNQGPCDHCSEEPEQAGDAGELKEYFLLR